LQTLFTQLRSGAPLPANGVASACAYCEMRGLCRQGSWEEAATKLTPPSLSLSGEERLRSPPDETTSHSTKPANGQVAGYDKGELEGGLHG
jgi:hypothetical protein